MDKTLTCIDCGKEFEFTEGEETFYQQKGLVPPKRCKKCRQIKRQERGNGESSHRPEKKFKSSYPRY